MQLEEIIQNIGAFGRFQKLQYSIACFASFCCALITVLPVYLLYIPSNRCRLPNLGASDSWQTPQSQVAQRVPTEACAPNAVGPCFSSCKLFANATSNDTIDCTNGVVFDNADIDGNFATELELVCDSQRIFLRTVLSQSGLVGFLIGASVGGFLSDRYGRKPTLMGSLLLMACAALSCGASSDPYSYYILYFLAGVGSSITFQTAFVIGMEFIGSDARLHAGQVIEYFFSGAQMALAGVAYFIRYWRLLSLAVSSFVLLIIPMFWFLRESPRWLMSVGKYDEAEAIIREAAEMNKAELPKELHLKSSSKEAKSESALGLFKSRSLLLMTLNLFLQWFVIAMVYYGLIYGPGNLPGSIYFNSFLGAVAETVGFIIPHIGMNFVGRRVAHVSSMAVSAASLISTIFCVAFAGDSNLDWLLVSLAMIGKAGISSAFCIIYLWTAELFPTTVRQIGVGGASTAGRIGTLLAPFLADLQNFIDSSFGSALPLLIFGCFALIAAIAAIFLPETSGVKLPETLEDAEMLSKRGKKALVEPIDSEESFAMS